MVAGLGVPIFRVFTVLTGDILVTFWVWVGKVNTNEIFFVYNLLIIRLHALLVSKGFYEISPLPPP